jgi:ubiquinone/menaquinone biosynthesis C-methylase UbiE
MNSNIIILLFCTLNFTVKSLYMFGGSSFSRVVWNKVGSIVNIRHDNLFMNRVKRELFSCQFVKCIYKEPGVFSKCIHLKKNIENTELQYPKYFTKHSDGNMNWQSAFIKAEYSNLGISANYCKYIDPVISEQNFRNNIIERIETYRNIHDIVEPPTHIIDIGCSIGGSTEFFKYNFRNSNIWGIDLNPYFLAVAEYRKPLYSDNINYIHANAEQIPFSDNTVDIVTMTLLLYEIPIESTIKILNESMRVLKYGGTLHIIDIEPNHNKYSFRKHASTDCHSHNYEYYKNDMTKILISCGFHNIVKYKGDKLISVWCAIKTDNEDYSINIVPKSFSSNKNNYSFVEN